jgi:hypothetical protein
MFERRTAAEWHADLRVPGRKLTLAEATCLARFDQVALLGAMHQDLCELKGMIKVLDLWLARSGPDGYRHPEDMRALVEDRR